MGSLVFYTGCKTDEQWHKKSGIDFSDTASVIQWFKREYAGWDNLYEELFENPIVPFVPRPQYCMPLDQTWKALPNLTMLGDAAHLMPPFAGEGVNMAMLDALELSQCLTSSNFTNVQAAIAAYEKQMRSRASVAAQASLESAAAMHSPEAIAYVMKVVS